MKLYSAVRVLRGVALGTATQSPAAAVITEVASVVPLFRNASSTVGGIMAVLYAGGEYAGETLELLERPLRSRLEGEFALLVLFLLAVAIAPP